MTRFWIPSGERLRSSIAEILLQSANGWSATSQRKHPTYNRGTDKPTSRTRQCPRADERRHVYIVGIDYAWKPTAHKGNLPLEDFELTQNIVTTFSQARTTDMHNVRQTDSVYHHLEFPF
jgi:hypothetical protein